MMDWQCLTQAGEMCRVAVQPTIGARIRAARAIGGFSKPQALAAVLKMRGLGATRLYEVERGAQKPPSYPALAEIGHLCGLPVEFFTADFDRLKEISDDARAAIAAEQATWEAEQRADTKPRGPRGQIGQRRTGAGPTLPTRKRRESPGEQDAKRGNEK